MYTQDDLAAAFDDDALRQIAKATGLAPDEFRARYAEALADPAALRKVDVEIGAAAQSGDCLDVPFEFSFFGILGVKGRVKICGGDCFEATIETCALLLGNEVSCRTLALDCHHTEACYSVDVWAARASICFGVRGSKLCVYVKGEACAWAGTWHCERFDETIVCLN